MGIYIFFFLAKTDGSGTFEEFQSLKGDGFLYLICKYDFLSGKTRASTTGFGIEFGPSIQAEVSPDETISGSSRLGASMSLPPLFSRSWSNTNDVESMQDFFSKGKIHKCRSKFLILVDLLKQHYFLGQIVSYALSFYGSKTILDQNDLDPTETNWTQSK